mmetsp:Transcript_56908/g.120961  ORF Transcript_56908/g.120961 Transcript_56908/m.120961 type:complete len:83 (+) Transcript_56908:113-361(+)
MVHSATQKHVACQANRMLHASMLHAARMCAVALSKTLADLGDMLMLTPTRSNEPRTRLEGNLPSQRKRRRRRRGNERERKMI